MKNLLFSILALAIVGFAAVGCGESTIQEPPTIQEDAGTAERPAGGKMTNFRSD